MVAYAPVSSFRSSQVLGALSLDVPAPVLTTELDAANDEGDDDSSSTAALGSSLGLRARSILAHLLEVKPILLLFSTLLFCFLKLCCLFFPFTARHWIATRGSGQDGREGADETFGYPAAGRGGGRGREACCRSICIGRRVRAPIGLW